jgi:predicted DNA-binding protein (UPF0251 family)
MTYQQGYTAGIKKAKADSKKEIEALRRQITELKVQNASYKCGHKRKVFNNSLSLVLQHCRNWTIDGKEIKDAAGYCVLARIFTKESIAAIDDLR